MSELESSEKRVAVIEVLEAAKVPVPHKRLASYLARRIFEAPHGWKGDRVQRIAFKGGDFKKETDMGGFGEDALTAHIRKALREYDW